MTKEDKQIINRAVKEEWRIGDRSRLKRLLEKNLEQYRENVELEQKLEQTEKDLADYQFNYPKIKELEKENAELKKINSETLTQLNLDNGELIIENEKLRKENAGLKAGRPQWHDLQKDPNDLPKEDKQYLCLIKSWVGGGKVYACLIYNTQYHSWQESYGDVIAWCEIPTFDKE